ncbi:hypothetical protein FIV07_12245 [Mycobacterium sp. THAF192]|nr:hypothetical protein FIV07_12245 [Mycobacterium sp. THAF192]
MLKRESLRTVYVEMVYSHDGPAATKESELRELATGTAFYYHLDGANYLITARHNVTGRHWKTGEYMGEYPMAPSHLKLTALAPPPTPAGWPFTPVPDDPTRSEIAMQITGSLIPLLYEDWSPSWLEHPTYGGRMDVVAIPLAPLPADEIFTAWNEPVDLEPSDMVDWPRLAAGVDVFIIGFPYRLTSGPFLPLWLRGTIASEPYFGYRVDDENLPLMLIDARTRKGQSGSPVIRHIGQNQFLMRRNGTPGLSILPQSDLVGVYSGRTSDESDLGYVWLMEEVEEICRRGAQGKA